MRSMAVEASRVAGMVAGSRCSPCAAHSPATSPAAASLGRTRRAPAGVFGARPSRRTAQPPSSAAVSTVFQKRFSRSSGSRKPLRAATFGSSGGMRDMSGDQGFGGEAVERRLEVGEVGGDVGGAGGDLFLDRK